MKQPCLLFYLLLKTMQIYIFTPTGIWTPETVSQCAALDPRFYTSMFPLGWLSWISWISRSTFNRPKKQVIEKGSSEQQQQQQEKGSTG